MGDIGDFDPTNEQGEASYDDEGFGVSEMHAAPIGEFYRWCG